MRLIYTVALATTLTFSAEMALAFPDVYEPDDSAEKAREISIDMLRTGEQHTLHQIDEETRDEDWFKFYAQEGSSYDINVTEVGSDVQVRMRLYTEDETDKPFDGSISPDKGENLSLFLPVEKSGFYYLRVVDVAEAPACRANIQYSLIIVNREAGDFPIKGVEGYVKDALTGDKIGDAIIKVTNCSSSVPKEVKSNVSGEGKGYYRIDPNCKVTDFLEISAEKEGYNTLTSKLFPASLGVDKTFKEDMALLPVNEKIPVPLPQQSGAHLQWDVSTLPQGGVVYYFGVQYPDNQFFVLPRRNDLRPFDTGTLTALNDLAWRNEAVLAIDEPVANFSRGIHKFYLLRTPKGAEPIQYLQEHPDALNNVDHEIKR